MKYETKILSEVNPPSNNIRCRDANYHSLEIHIREGWEFVAAWRDDTVMPPDAMPRQMYSVKQGMHFLIRRAI